MAGGDTPGGELAYVRRELRKAKSKLSGVEVIADSLIGQCDEPDCDTCATLREIQVWLASPYNPEESE